MGRLARQFRGVASRARTASVWRNLSRYVPAVVLCVILLVAFVGNLRVATRHSLVTADGANYLYTMQQVFGLDFAGVGVLRPPLIAVPLKLASLVVGPLRGITAVGLMISVGVGVPFYLVARRVSSPLMASLSAGLFVLTPEYSSMLGWGYITMFGIFFSLFAFHFLLQAIDDPCWRNIFLSGLMASMIAGFHQVSIILFLLVMAAFSLLLLFADHKNLRRVFLPLVSSGLLAAILAIPYVPSYLDQMRQASGGSEILLLLPSGVQGATALVTRVLHYYHPGQLWLLAFPAAAVGLVTMHRYDRRVQLLVVSALMVTFSLGASQSVTAANRAMYFSYIPVWLLFAGGVNWVLDKVSTTSRACTESGRAR